MEGCVRTTRGTVLLSEAARRNKKLLDSFKIGHEKCQPRAESSGQYPRPQSSEAVNRRRKAKRPASLYDFRTQYNVDSWEKAKTAEFHEPVPNKMLSSCGFLESRNACIEPVGRCNETKETSIGHAEEIYYVATQNSSPRSTIIKSRVEHSELEPSSRYRDSGSSRKSTAAPSNFEQMKEKGEHVHRDHRKIDIPDFLQNPSSHSSFVKSRTVEQSEQVEQLELEPETRSENLDGMSTEQMNQKDNEPEKMNRFEASQYLDLGNEPLVCKVVRTYSDTQGRGKHADEFKKLKIEAEKTSEDEWSTADSAKDEEKLEIRQELEGGLINDLFIGPRTMNAGQSFQNSKKLEATNEECEGNSKNMACCDEAKSTKYRDKDLGLLIVVCYDGRSELNDDNNNCICHWEQQLKGEDCDDIGHNGKMGTVGKKNHEEGTCFCLKSRNGLEKEKSDMLHQEAKKVDNAVALCCLNEIKSIMHENDDSIKVLKKEEATGSSGISYLKEYCTDEIETDAKIVPTYSENCSTYIVMSQNKWNLYCSTSKHINLSPLLGSQSSKALLIHDQTDAGADISMEGKDLTGSLETNAADINTAILSELESSEECIVPQGLYVAKLKTSRVIDEILSKTASIWACTKDIGIIILNINDNKELKIVDKIGAVNEKEISAILKDKGNYVLHSVDFGACANAPKLPEETAAAEYLVVDSKGTVVKKASRSSVATISQISTERNTSRHEFVDQVPSVQEESGSGIASTANANEHKAPVVEQESYFVLAKPKSPNDANGATKSASDIFNPSVSGDEDEASSEKEVKSKSDAKIFLGKRLSTVLSQHYQQIYEPDSNGDSPLEGKCDSEEVMKKSSLSQSAKITSENDNVDCKNSEPCRDTVCSSLMTRSEQTVMEKGIKIRSTDKGNEKQDIFSSFDARFARLCWKIERYSSSSMKGEVKRRESPFSICTSLDPNNSARKERKKCLLTEKRSKSLSSSKTNDSHVLLSKKYGMARNSDIRPKDDENIHVEENLIFNDDIDGWCKKNGNGNENADKNFNGSQKKYFEASESNFKDEKRETMITNSKEGIEAIVEALSENSNDTNCTYGGERRLSNTQLNAKNETGKEKWQTKISREQTTKVNDTELPEEYKRRLKKSKCFEILCEDGQDNENGVDAIRHIENDNIANAACSAHDSECEVEERERTENYLRAISDSKNEKDERRNDRNEKEKSVNSHRRRSRRSDYRNEDEVNDEKDSSKRTSYSYMNKETKCNEQEKIQVDGSNTFHKRLLSRSLCFDMGSGNEEKEASRERIHEVKYKNTENWEDNSNRKKSLEESRKHFMRSKREEINANNEWKQHGRKGRYQDNVRNENQIALDCITDEISDENYNKQCYSLTPFGKCSLPSVKKEKETSTEENENALDRRLESNRCMELPESKRRRFRRLKFIEGRIEDEQEVSTEFHQSKKDILDDQCMPKEGYESSNEKRSLHGRYKRLTNFEQCMDDCMGRDFEENSVVSINKDIKSNEIDFFVKKKEGCGPFQNNGLEINKINFENNIRYEGEESDGVKHDIALNCKKFEACSTKDEEVWHSKEAERLAYRETCARNAEQEKAERKWNTRDFQAVVAIECELNASEGKGKASTKSERTSTHWKTNADCSAERIEVDISNEKQYDDVDSKGLLLHEAEKMDDVCVRRKRRTKCFLAGAENDQNTNGKDCIVENQHIEGTEEVPFSSRNIQEDSPEPHRESCNLDKSNTSGEEKLREETFTIDSKEAVGQSDDKQCNIGEKTCEGLYEGDFSKKTENNEALRCGTYELSVIHVDKSQEINSESDQIVKETNDLQGKNITGLQLNKEIMKSDFTIPELGNELGNVCNERKKLTVSNLIDYGCLSASKITDNFENLQEDTEKCKQKHERRILFDSNATSKNISTLREYEDTFEMKTEMAGKVLERLSEEDDHNAYYINNTEDPVDGNIRKGDAMLKDYKLTSYESKMRKIKQKMQQLVHRNTEMEERIECGARDADMCEDKQWKYFLKKQKLIQLAVTKLWQKEGFDSSRLIQDKEYNVYMTEYDLHRKR